MTNYFLFFVAGEELPIGTGIGQRTLKITHIARLEIRQAVESEPSLLAEEEEIQVIKVVEVRAQLECVSTGAEIDVVLQLDRRFFEIVRQNRIVTTLHTTDPSLFPTREVTRYRNLHLRQ